jgi:hypothetical protein
MENPYLDRIAGERDSILAFDCEFWHVLASTDEGFHIVPNQPTNFFFLPREVGGFLLKKEKGKWKLAKDFFATFSPPTDRDVAFPISHYSSVTGPTGYKLDELEHHLGLPWGEAFPSLLSDEGKAIHEEGLRFYSRDPKIKAAHKPVSWFQTFMNMMQKCVVIVKGTKDIESLMDASKLFGLTYKEPGDLVDIALWNDKSYKQCRTAKLEGTYKCIAKSIPDEVGDGKRLRDILPIGRAHDPMADAAMTLLIALYIESKSPMG